MKSATSFTLFRLVQCSRVNLTLKSRATSFAKATRSTDDHASFEEADIQIRRHVDGLPIDFEVVGN